MDNLTETEWDHLCNRYIYQQIYNTPLRQTKTGSPSYRQETKFKVSLKEFPTTTGKKEDWTKYRRKRSHP